MIDDLFINFLNKVVDNPNVQLRKIGQYKNLPNPSLVASVTTRCNFRCPHCLRELVDGRKTVVKDLSPEAFDIFLREAKKIANRSVFLTGGEPILSPYFPRLIELIEKHGYKYGLVSNGWLYKDYWPFIEKSRKNFIHLALSIDGVDAGTHDGIRRQPGSFEKLIDAINFYRKNNVPLMASFCLMKENVSQVEAIVDFCRKMDIKHLRYVMVIDFGQSSDIALDADEHHQVFKKIIRLKNKFGSKINILTSKNFTDRSFALNSGRLISFCPLLNGRNLFLDHDGALMFCCDLYRNCRAKPLVEDLGFKRCLEINMDVMNQLKKQHAADLLDGSLPEFINFCDFCNNYVEEFFELARKRQ